ncbi:MAG: DMT family transporter [Kofleriaceae bacterium]
MQPPARASLGPDSTARPEPERSPAPAGGLALGALLCVGMLWSTGGLLIKLVPWPSLAIWSMRSAVAALVLLAIKRPSWKGVSRTELLAGLAFAATMGLFIAANKYTTAANAILIQYSAPAWAALLGWLVLGERASRLDWTTVALALLGIALFFFDRLTLEHNLGNLFSLIAGFTFAAHAVLLRKLWRAGGSPLRAMLLGYLLSTVIGLPSVLTAGPLSQTGWLALLGLGALQQAIPALLYAWAIQRVSALEGLLIPIVEPLFNPVWVWLAMGEQPGRWALAGGALVVGAITGRAVLLTRRGPSARRT